MNRRAIRLIAVAVACATVALGAAGAYSYGRDYLLHRGFATVVQLPRAGTGRLLNIHFHSTALHRRADYMVYLPPGYSSARRYPVDYLLHGMPGQPRVFVTIANLDVRLDNLIARHQAKPMLLVFPDGRIGGSVLSDSEWANSPTGHYESYVLEVMHDVDARFSTLPYRQDRVIAGFSAGAYGAVNIALHHLSDFAAVQAWSGYFTETRSGVFAHASRATLAYNSPYRYVRRVAGEIRRDGLRAFLFVGRDDEASAQLRPMVARLRAAGALVGDKIYPGGHDWGVWYPRLNAMLTRASRDLGSAPSPVRASLRRAGQARARTGILAASSPVGAGFRPGQTGDLISPQGLLKRPGATRLALIAALLLAVLSGALINVGFVVQQRGLMDGRCANRQGAVAAIANRTWLKGQLVGWVGFAGQIVAVALAPLTLVQAFAAGSLALSLPVVARLFDVRVGRAQLRAIALVALCLSLLPVGFAGHRAHLSAGILIGGALMTGTLAAAVASVPRGIFRAVAAGLCYGLADAAIKADAIGMRAHGAAGLLSGWTVLASVATLAGFVLFQWTLRHSNAVTAISVMNVLAAVSAIALGALAFGESLGVSPVWSAVHLAAIATVLACIRPLARGQEVIAGAREAGPPLASSSSPARHHRPWRTAARSSRRGLGGLAAVAVTFVTAAASVGLTYTLRGAGWLAAGPRVPDALPLLQLAGAAGQPLVRVAVPALIGGTALGVLLGWLPVGARVALVLLAASLALLAASDASLALARNLRLAPVALTTAPGLGPWLQALLLAVAAAAPELWRALRAGLVPARLVGAGGVDVAPGTAPQLERPDPCPAVATTAAEQ